MKSRKAVARLGCGLAILVYLVACDSTTPAQHVEQAQVALQDREYRLAVIELKNALQKDASFVSARSLLGKAYLTQGDYASALKELERALDLGDRSIAVQEGVGRAKLGLGRYQEVIGDLAELTDRPLALDLLLADAHLKAGEFQLAEPLYQRGAQTPVGRSGLAVLAWQRGNRDAARDGFEASVQGVVPSPEIWLRKAEFELDSGDFPAAKASFRKATETPAGRVLGGLGVVRSLLAENDLDAATEAIDKILKIAGNYPLARYLEGLIYYQKNDFDRSEAALLEVQRRFPDHAPTLYLMGLVKYQLDQIAQAEYNVERFVLAAPANESARKLLASIRLQRGELDAAIEALEPVAQTSVDAQLLAMLGTAMTQAGRTAEASALLSRAVELAPEGAGFRNQLALSLLSAGEEELARSELEAAIDIDGSQVQSDYLLAMLQLRDDELDEARASIEAIVEKSPDNPLGPNLLGAVALAEGNSELAETEFRNALKLDPDFVPAVTNLSRLLENRGDLGGAEQLYRSRTEAAPSDVTGHLGLTDFLLRNGRSGEALSAAKGAVAADPMSARARVALARLYRLEGNLSDAEASIDAALTAIPENPDLKLMKAELALAAGKPDEARRFVNDLQVLFSRTQVKNPELAVLLGRMQAQLGNRAVARANYETALGSTDTEANPTALLELGRLNLIDGRYAAVEQQLRALSELEGVETARQRSLLEADMFAARGQLDKATELYEPLRASGSREATLRLAQLALRDGRPNDAISMLEERLAESTDDQGARLLLGGALLSVNDKSAAIQQYESLVETGNPVVLNNLAWLYMEAGDARAVELGEQAYRAAATNADVVDTYGWILVRNGKTEAGVKILKESIRLRGDNPTVQYHLAYAEAKLGKTAQARERLASAIGLGEFPERADAEALLSSLSDS
ncbi:MAG: XrtA/PEP-CTERM system TPR-repeat protein PrsT [Pseudomonadota bacterium]